MKKHSPILIKCLIGLTILIGVLIILMVNEKGFNNIVADDIENISKLSSSIIYAEIDNSLTKPIFVGQTMANDTFLKDWLSKETAGGNDSNQTKIIQKYLTEYSKKYGYDSVFLTSAKSNVYYSQKGVNKVVSRDNAHDIWYYLFVDSGKSYDLDVDTDEVNSNQLTVFVNCRITDENDNFMGVVGVGIKMSHLQELLLSYEKEYDLKAFLINDKGLVQADSVVKNIETENFFDDQETAELKGKILKEKDSLQIFWYPKGGTDNCLITKYVSNLDWYLVIEKNTLTVEKQLASQFHKDLVIVGIIIIMVILMISYVFSKYSRMLLKTAGIDDVTNLPNMKMFQEIFLRNTKRPACHEGIVFLFDIDMFKRINDKFGHLFGNTLLYRVSEIAKNAVGNKGVVARFGGDEFVGIIYGSADEAAEILEKIVKDVSNIKEGKLDAIAISLGATGINVKGSLDGMLEEADQAMYQVKEMGGNKVAFYKP